MAETAKERFWREWAIDGMPKDKQRLAEAAWTEATEAVRMNQPEGGEAVADVEDVLRRARRIARKINDDMPCDDYLNLSADLLELLEKALSPRTGLSIFRTTPPAAQVQQEAVAVVDGFSLGLPTLDWSLTAPLTIGTTLYTHPAADALEAVRELPSAETLSSLLWRDWMTTEQADGLGRDMHGWLQAHAALAQAPAVRVTATIKKHDGPCWRNSYSDCGC